MILTCSSCATRFLVNAAAIGPAGRHVRCARCQHGWFQEPAVDLPRSVPPEAGTDTDKASRQDTRPFADMVTPAARPTPLRRGANLPAIPRKSSRMAGIVSWGALAVFVISLLGGGYVFRNQITHTWPQAAKLYVALGLDLPLHQLRLTDVSFAQGMQEGRPALTVKGMISNDSGAEMTAPRVLVKLRNAAGRDIFQWIYQLPEPVLGAGTKVKFETSLADPPGEARNLEVTFAPGG